MARTFRATTPSDRKPVRWNWSPGLVDPRWRPFIKHLVFLLPFWEGAGPPFDYVGRRRGTLQGTDVNANVWRRSIWGSGLDFEESGLSPSVSGVAYNHDPALSITGPLTLLAVAAAENPVASDNTLISKGTAGTGTEYNLTRRTSDGAVRFSHGDGVGNFATYTSTLTMAAGVISAAVLRRPTNVAGGTVDMFLDGKGHLGIAPSESRVAVASAANLGIGRRDFDNNQRWDGIVLMAAVFNTALPRETCRWLSAHPFGLIQMARRRIVAAAGTVNLRASFPQQAIQEVF